MAVCLLTQNVRMNDRMQIDFHIFKYEINILVVLGFQHVQQTDDVFVVGRVQLLERQGRDRRRGERNTEDKRRAAPSDRRRGAEIGGQVHGVRRKCAERQTADVRQHGQELVRCERPRIVLTTLC